MLGTRGALGTRDRSERRLSYSPLWVQTHTPSCWGDQVALPFELVEDEGSHHEESDDKEDGHRPVATAPSQPLSTCNTAAISGSIDSGQSQGG